MFELLGGGIARREAHAVQDAHAWHGARPFALHHAVEPADLLVVLRLRVAAAKQQQHLVVARGQRLGALARTAIPHARTAAHLRN